MPAGMGRLFVNPSYNWCFMAHSAAESGSRELYLPQGKVLGGSSSINGMAFVRGHPQDYDRWQELGAEGWNWQSVLPYFIELEQRSGPAAELRGTKGPLGISEPTFRHPSSKAFVEAAVRAGLRDADRPRHAEAAAFHNGRRRDLDRRRIAVLSVWISTLKELDLRKGAPP